MGSHSASAHWVYHYFVLRNGLKVIHWTETCRQVLIMIIYIYICVCVCVFWQNKLLYHIYMIQFEENLSGFFPWDLPVVKISPEWVTDPEQGTSSGRIADFSFWTGMFRDGISSISVETVIPLWLGRHFLVCENRVYHEKVRMTVGVG